MLLLILMLLGIVLYVLPVNGKVNEIGRLMFACALLAFCLQSHSDLLRALR